MEMEREGFKPSIRITRTTDWQSAALVHAAISPIHKVKKKSSERICRYASGKYKEK